ncbi:MAG: LamG domain-containing protein, partial [Planctomycetota bacterium]
DFSDWSHIAIGGNPKGTWNKHFFNGQIDEIAIYNQALSAEKVQQLYQSQAAIYQEPSASSGLIAHWKFDEGSGTAAHDSAGGHRGIVRGAAWTAGKLGMGLGFDGIDDVVVTAMNVDQSDSSKGATFCAWVYPTSISEGRHHVISSDNSGYDWSLLREADIWCVFTGEGSRSAGFGVDLFTWQHVMAVFVPGTGVKFYKNGVEFTIPHIDYDDSDNNIAVGGSPARREGFFAGVIDEVMIFDRPLTAPEVEQVYLSAEEIKRPSSGISRGPERRTSSGWVDILESIDVERDAKGGDWRREDGTLIGFAQSTLQTSYKLPAEYDVLWEFESNSTAINLLLASPLGRRFEWMMKGWSHRLCGIREVDCKPVNDNETTTAFPLESGARYVAEVKVRRDRFVALINGKEILNYKTDWSNVEVCKPWHPFELQGRRLGLWLNKHWTKTYRLKVRPHRGDRGVADNLIVPGTRVGNYAIGISKDDVLRSLGKPNLIFHRGEKYTLDNLPKEYFMVYDDISFGVVDDSVKGIGVHSSLYKFANGLRVGDSEQKIKQAFGDNCHFKETEGKDFLTYRDQGIQFEIHKKDRTVIELSVFESELRLNKKAHLPLTSTLDEDGRIVDKIDYPFINDSQIIGTWKSVARNNGKAEENYFSKSLFSCQTGGRLSPGGHGQKGLYSIQVTKLPANTPLEIWKVRPTCSLNGKAAIIQFVTENLHIMFLRSSAK